LRVPGALPRCLPGRLRPVPRPRRAVDVQHRPDQESSMIDDRVTKGASALAGRGAAALALAAAALVSPAVASAHPSAYFSTAKIAATPEIQTLTPSGGNWTPTAGAAAVSSTATAAQVQAAFMAASAIGYAGGSAPGYDNVRVSGNPGGPYTVTFVGTLAGVN